MKNNLLIVFVMAIFTTLTLTSSVIIVNAAPNSSSDPRCDEVYDESNPTIGKVECCDVVLEGGELVNYCTICDATNPPSNCSERYPHLTYKEEPPSTDDQPMKPDISVAPNDDSNAIEEQQPTNPTFNPNEGSIINENLAEDQPMQFSSNNEQNQESEQLSAENNPNTESNSQENDETSNSETTHSLSNRGNTQNSPVPPECPTQGPIPPDCTMKPKF